MNARSFAIPRAVWWATAMIAAAGLVTPNSVPTLAAAGVVPFVFLLLWRAKEPPALLFSVGLQWLQVFVPIMNANLAGISLADSPLASNLDKAAYLGLLAITVLAMGMRLGRGRRRLELAGSIMDDGVPFTPAKLWLAYALVHAIGYAALGASASVPSLRQELLVLNALRTSVIFIIIWAGATRPRFRSMAIAVALIEVAFGFLGFFSSYKIVIFVAIIVLLTATPSPRKLLRPAVVAAAAILLILLIFWQAVKIDYRAFLNQGTGAQVILVSPMQRIAFLIERASAMDVSQLRAGFESGAERTGYLEYFGLAITMVPSYIPYQNGRLWGEAVRHVLTPRLFFPDKPAIDDSRRVSEFTGQRVAGAEEGTSISLGYVAESYIDFGPIFMFLPILLLGVFFGWAYRLLATTGRHRLLSLGFAVSFVLSSASLFESSNIKIVGGALTALIVGWCVIRFGSPWIWLVLSGSDRLGRTKAKTDA